MGIVIENDRIIPEHSSFRKSLAGAFPVVYGSEALR
jgi:hypothetical protein